MELKLIATLPLQNRSKRTVENGEVHQLRGLVPKGNCSHLLLLATEQKMTVAHMI